MSKPHTVSGDPSEMPASPSEQDVAQAAADRAIESSAPKWLVAVREGTTTCIAAGIVLVTLILLLETFDGAGGTAFNDKKEVLLYALPLLGSVLGYYFGRVPAERRAETSEQEADQARLEARSSNRTAQVVEQRTEAKLRQVEKQVERAKAKLEMALDATPGVSTKAAPGDGPTGPTTDSEAVRAAFGELETLGKLI